MTRIEEIEARLRDAKPYLEKSEWYDDLRYLLAEVTRLQDALTYLHPSDRIKLVAVAEAAREAHGDGLRTIDTHNGYISVPRVLWEAVVYALVALDREESS